ncbi:MAG: DUF2191 domain-containing protein [Fimbriimonadaceae bacterium]|jgi:uncharacterized protein YqfA (UPF0365 family)|nr:DUF2191 domain-containing protein [Fimbriimonadaceae bacterium]
MKTTVEIADALLDEAKRVAAERETTLRSLIEEGLRKVLEEEPKKPFKLRDCSVDGNGLTPEFQNATWEQFRDAIYEGRGA